MFRQRNKTYKCKANDFVILWFFMRNDFCQSTWFRRGRFSLSAFSRGLRFAKVKGFLEDEPSMSKKQKIINFLVFASFATQMIDMPFATLANAVISIRKPISGFFAMRILPGRCVTSRDSAVLVTL